MKIAHTISCFRQSYSALCVVCLFLVTDFICGCVIDDDLSTDLFFTKLELYAATSNEPVTSTQIRVAATPRTPFVEPSRQSILVAPTDAMGQTLVPLATARGLFAGEPYSGLLEVTIQSESSQRMFVVSNTDGSCAVDEDYKVCVLSVRAGAPEDPRVEVVLRTKPATVRINGYLGQLWVCDVQSDAFVWRIRSVDAFPFVSEIVLGDTPSGFVDDDDGIRACSWMLSSWTNGANRVGWVNVPGREESLVFSYCVSDDETVIECGR
jgi:hypothetical protein